MNPYKASWRTSGTPPTPLSVEKGIRTRAGE